MSWILGFVSRAAGRPEMARRCRALHPPPLHEIDNDVAYVAAGGLSETCLHVKARAANRSVEALVVGLGLQADDTGCRLWDAARWQTNLTRGGEQAHPPGGHFVVVRMRPDGAEVWNDVLGLRDLYFTSLPEGVVFSTRSDWVAQLRGGTEIDFAEFGGQWNLFNQLSARSVLDDVVRLGPHSRATFTPDGYEHANSPYLPREGAPQEADAFVDALARWANPYVEGRAVSLGLSGGLDSRLLLALRPAASLVHTFGPRDHPDARLARRIADEEGYPLTHLHEPVPDAETCLRMAGEFVVQTHALMPASAVVGLRYYEHLHEQGKMMIDGGYGELGRRQYMNRLYVRGRSALRAGAPEELLPFLRLQRAALFNAETSEVMQAGVRRQIAEAWEEMPPMAELGADNFLDLLAIRTRIPNSGGPEQARLDGEIINYMPYLQTSVLEATFQTEAAARRSGRHYHQAIRSRAPRLAGYPLIKGSVRYPFGLGLYASRAWVLLKERLLGAYRDTRRDVFLTRVKEPVLDLLYSSAVRSYGPYDQAALHRFVTGYYEGEAALGGAVDWWLSFELWRQRVTTGLTA